MTITANKQTNQIRIDTDDQFILGDFFPIALAQLIVFVLSAILLLCGSGCRSTVGASSQHEMIQNLSILAEANDAIAQAFQGDLGMQAQLTDRILQMNQIHTKRQILTQLDQFLLPDGSTDEVRLAVELDPQRLPVTVLGNEVRNQTMPVEQAHQIVADYAAISHLSQNTRRSVEDSIVQQFFTFKQTQIEIKQIASKMHEREEAIAQLTYESSLLIDTLISSIQTDATQPDPVHTWKTLGIVSTDFIKDDDLRVALQMLIDASATSPSH